MNVEIGVATAEATVETVSVVVRAMKRFASKVFTTSVVAAPVLRVLRQGRSSISAIPGDINFTNGGNAAAVA